MTGIHFLKDKCVWKAYAFHDGKRQHLGYFVSKSLALNAVAAFRKKNIPHRRMDICSELTAAFVRMVFNYDPLTGILTWRDHRMHRGLRLKPDNVAGRIENPGRNQCIVVCLNNKTHQAHRIAWLHYYGTHPTEKIFHADGDGLNNRIQNLVYWSWFSKNDKERIQ